MTTLNATTGLTLVEVAKRHDPNGQLATIAEVLAQKNEILQDAIWVESNDRFSNKSTRRSSLPAGTWRKLNSGVAAERSTTIEVIDTIGLLESEMKNDKRLIDSFDNPAQARSDEAAAFMEGLSQEMAATMMYGNTTASPEEFTGLAPRMASLATTANVLTAGGSGSDLTSIFVVDWAPTKVCMLYPKGSQAGLQHEDMDVQVVQDGSSNDYRAYVDFFSWEAGMAVKHPKAIGRIANIESAGSSNIFDEDDLITLLNRMTSGPGMRIYVNETVKTQMEIRLKDKTNVNFSTRDGLGGVPVLHFRGIPVRKVDQILITEAALT